MRTLVARAVVHEASASVSVPRRAAHAAEDLWDRVAEDRAA